MSHMTVSEALDRLDLTDVWDMAPNPNKTPTPARGNVVVKSPFRLDHKGKSFSVDADLRLFKDHSNDSKGGVWKFVQMCEPSWSKQQIAREIIRRAGGDPDMRDPNYKPKSRAERHRQMREAGDRARREFQKQQTHLEIIPEEKLLDWPDHLRRRWSNYDSKQCNEARVDVLADERGWPVDWVWGLIDSGKMVFNKNGQPVFRVEAPSDRSDMRSIGVHYRWFSDDGGKFWSYRPCQKWDKREIVAAPLVLGSLNSPLWIVTEGQWDAVTAWGLLGGFDDVMLLDAAVLGVRGVSGVSVFMSLYKALIRKCHPTIVLVPDADDAARWWTENEGKKWSFMRRIQGVFPSLKGKIGALKLKPQGTAKDLNDFYKDYDLGSGGFLNMLNEVLLNLKWRCQSR